MQLHRGSIGANQLESSHWSRLDRTDLQLLRSLIEPAWKRCRLVKMALSPYPLSHFAAAAAAEGSINYDAAQNEFLSVRDSARAMRRFQPQKTIISGRVD